MARAAPTYHADPSAPQDIPISSLVQMLLASNGGQRQDAPWVQNLKRLVDPNVDPRGELIPRNPNADLDMNRTGPRVGDVLAI